LAADKFQVIWEAKLILLDEQTKKIPWVHMQGISAFQSNLELGIDELSQPDNDIEEDENLLHIKSRIS
jgi:hypothetical protein